MRHAFLMDAMMETAYFKRFTARVSNLISMRGAFRLIAAEYELWQNTVHDSGSVDVYFLNQPNIVIARVIGILAIAAGFLLGIEGLNQPDSIWLSVALSLIVTGLCAQVYAFYRTIMAKMPSRNTQDS